MRWGLLAGLGQGINQAANTLNAGMAEDRATKREAERAAIETDRWERTFAFKKEQAEEQRKFQAEQLGLQRESFDFQKSEAQDARAFREGRAKVEDDRYTRSEKRGAIDSEVRFILDDYNVMTRAIAQQATEEIRAAQKEVELLTRAQRSADPMATLSAEGVNVNPENITGRINALNKQIGAIRSEQKAKLQELRVERDRGLSVIKSHYGDSISKSSFAATLSDLGLPKAEAKEVTELAFSEFAKGALDDNGYIIAPTGKAIGAPGGNVVAANASQQALDGGSLTPRLPTVEPGLLGGFMSGRGGIYDPTTAVNYGAMSPAEQATTFVGRGAGYVVGGGAVRDARLAGTDAVTGFADWVTRRPQPQQLPKQNR